MSERERGGSGSNGRKHQRNCDLLSKNAIREGGSTALLTAYTVYTVLNTVYTVYILFNYTA